jgi:thymidylate kinase
VILGPDGAGKSSVIDGLLGRLTSIGLTVRVRHLKPRIVAVWRGQTNVVVVDPHGSPSRGALFSLAKILVWILEEWYSTLFQEKRGTLLICDRYFHDLLVDPKRYRFGAPMWVARLVGRVMPQPRLWVLLDAPAEVLQKRKQEVAPEETARQCGEYRRFIGKQRKHFIADASQPLEKVMSDVERAVRASVIEGGQS